MKNILKITLVITLMLTFSCQREEDLQLEENSLTEIEKKLESLHFNINNIEVTDFLLPDGKTQQMYKVENDIVLSEKQILAMKESNIGTKQYHTYNLANYGTYTVIGYTGGGGYGLSSKARTALSWAVNNYNSLNLGIHLQLSYGTNYGNKDLVVYNNPTESGNGGVSGFPNNGNPFKWVQIYGMEGYSTNANEHVITHEIGHSFGLRHTDWFSRESCDESGESAGWDGALHIPGTPTGYDSTSLMLACFNGGTNGEFNNNDRTALHYLY